MANGVDVPSILHLLFMLINVIIYLIVTIFTNFVAITNMMA
jgi:hypothetical protein